VFGPWLHYSPRRQRSTWTSQQRPKRPGRSQGESQARDRRWSSTRACAHRPSLGNRPTPFIHDNVFSLKGFGRLPSQVEGPTKGFFTIGARLCVSGSRWSMCSAPSLANPLFHKTKHVRQRGLANGGRSMCSSTIPGQSANPLFHKRNIFAKGVWPIAQSMAQWQVEHVLSPFVGQPPYSYVCQMGFGQWRAEHVLIDHP